MSANTATITQCPYCEKRFRVETQHVGRSARCPACHEVFVVASQGLPLAESQTPSAPHVEYIGINCVSCETRYYGTPRQLGSSIACPDCGTLNMVRRADRQDTPIRPAALDGEQYQLWEGDNQPWGSELAASQLPLARVLCDFCGSLQYVDEELQGTRVACIDCGKEVIVRAPHSDVPTGPVPVKAGEEYELDDDWSGSLEPAVHLTVHTQLQQEVSAEERERRIRLVATNRKARPRLPAQPLLTGYAEFFQGEGMLLRWFTLSSFTFAAIGLVLLAATVAMGLATIAALFLVLAAFGIALLLFGAGSASAMAITAESSEGNSYIHQWPSNNPTDWMMESFVMACTLGVAGFPGAGLAYAANIPSLVGAVMLLVSIWLVFPITFLSSLEGSSPFALLMPGVLGSLVRQGPWWLQFYILSGLLIATGAGLVVASLLTWPVLLMVISPLFWLGAAVYFRLLGRLAWRIREE